MCLCIDNILNYECVLLAEPLKTKQTRVHILWGLLMQQRGMVA